MAAALLVVEVESEIARMRGAEAASYIRSEGEVIRVIASATGND